jgi:hypothetical protein
MLLDRRFGLFSPHFIQIAISLTARKSPLSGRYFLISRRDQAELSAGVSASATVSATGSASVSASASCQCQ